MEAPSRVRHKGAIFTRNSLYTSSRETSRVARLYWGNFARSTQAELRLNQVCRPPLSSNPRRTAKNATFLQVGQALSSLGSSHNLAGLTASLRSRRQSWTVSSTSTDAPQTSRPSTKAAFFDVDGTIAKTNIVWPYVYLRLRELSAFWRLLWVPYFAVLTLLYRLTDKIDRGLLCRLVYLNYKGRPAAAAPEWGSFTYQEYVRPRIFQGAFERIRELKAAGFRVVLVTGSLKFMVAPLAAEIEADEVIAADLVERNGRFTGEMAGTAFNVHDKESFVKEYAAKHGIDLQKSHAYGDSIADLRMLESVGHPHAVLPDKKLLQIALKRGWPVVTDWAVEEKPPNPLTRLWV